MNYPPPQTSHSFFTIEAPRNPNRFDHPVSRVSYYDDDDDDRSYGMKQLNLARSVTQNSEGWSTASKVALGAAAVVGGLALLGAFLGDDQDKKKNNK